VAPAGMSKRGGNREKGAGGVVGGRLVPTFCAAGNTVFSAIVYAVICRIRRRAVF